MIAWLKVLFQRKRRSAESELVYAVLRDVGYSMRSAELRVGLFERLAECERRGIDPIAELRKALPVIVIPVLPRFEIPLSPLASPPEPQ